MESLPKLSALVERYSKDRFAVIGVSPDDAEQIRTHEATRSLAWPTIAEASSSGPIAEAWGVSTLGRMFVIDREGVIRGRGTVGPELLAEIDARLGR